MTVKLRPYRSGGWEVDIRVRLADGRIHRERRKSPVESRSGSRSWGEARERHIIAHGPKPKPTRPKAGASSIPTLTEFAARYIEGYSRANREKPSTMQTKQCHLRTHLLPMFGDRRLDELRQEDIQRLKGRLANHSAKTVNNVLTTLSTMLKTAVEWELIPDMPVRIKQLKVTAPEMDFYDIDEYERLVAAAKQLDPRIHILVLLGGDAGLRPGEVRALQWTAIDFRRRLLTVELAEYQGHTGLPKHDKIRRIPMTKRLAAALRAHRHQQGPKVLYRDEGTPLTVTVARRWLKAALELAELRDRGPHTLRHTFCSHLAMRGAPAKAIQELAGHSDLKTTQRYMHLSPATLERSIQLLESRGTPGVAESRRSSRAAPREP
ncbi:MAG: site-specific integrase [Enhygromyxa sp.]